jgi:uncharacterized alpha-E superfamily protein
MERKTKPMTRPDTSAAIERAEEISRLSPVQSDRSLSYRHALLGARDALAQMQLLFQAGHFHDVVPWVEALQDDLVTLLAIEEAAGE